MVAASTTGLALDPALPHRDRLLDAAAMRGTLSTVLGRDAAFALRSCSIVRTNYRVGRSMRAVYRAEVDGETYTIAARMFGGSPSAEHIRRSLPAAHAIGPLRAVAFEPALDAVFFVFPTDRRIASLEIVLAPDTRVPGVRGRSAVRKRLVAYAPEKSATLACESADGTAVAYAKVTAALQAERDHRTYTSLRAALDPRDRVLRLPRPIAYSDVHRTLWLEAIEGRRMSESDGDDEIGDLARLGAAVATFHDLDAPEAPVFTRFAPDRLAEDAAIVRAIRPDASSAVDRLVERLTAREVADPETVCLHGDLHAKNAIVCADRIALIDVEDVARGPASADIGSLVASLVYRRETGGLPASACAARIGAFLAGYDAVRRLPSRASLAWHSAAALLMERASRAITRIRPLGLEHLPALLSAAERLLDRGVEA